MKLGKDFRVTPLTVTYDMKEDTKPEGEHLPSHSVANNPNRYIIPIRIAEELRSYLVEHQLDVILFSDRVCQNGLCLHTFYLADFYK